MQVRLLEYIADPSWVGVRGGALRRGLHRVGIRPGWPDYAFRAIVIFAVVGAVCVGGRVA